jgi:hypothetical protein
MRNYELKVCNIASCHIVWSDCRRGFGLDIVFVGHLQVANTSNYNVITIAHFTKTFPARSVFTSSCLLTASSNG